MTNTTWRLVVAIAALVTVGGAGFALGAGLASEPVSAPANPVAAVTTAVAEMPATSVDGGATPSSAAGPVTTVAEGSPASATTGSPVATSGPSVTEAGDRVEVTIDNFAFSPSELSVPAGTTVVFINEDDVVHNVLSEDGQLQSPDLGAGDSYEVTLDQPGTIPYICNIHQYMRGTVTVTA